MIDLDAARRQAGRGGRNAAPNMSDGSYDVSPDRGNFEVTDNELNEILSGIDLPPQAPQAPQAPPPRNMGNHGNMGYGATPQRGNNASRTPVFPQNNHAKSNVLGEFLFIFLVIIPCIFGVALYVQSVME